MVSRRLTAVIPLRFDCGEGYDYYCWRYPAESLGFFHGYEEGFQGRVPIA
jgi:hypothetical protein